MTTKRANKNTTPQPANCPRPKIRDVECEITEYGYHNREFWDSFGVKDHSGEPVKGWKVLQVLSAVVLPDDPNENPHHYFDYEGRDIIAQALREGRIYGTPAEFWAKGKEREFLEYLYAKYPKVKRVQA
ncbi:MAG: hypothetical protein M9919_05205 [Burkholderiaceae bacterium]|nr:hypothetical protein [Burkholderiaceae bacterium]